MERHVFSFARGIVTVLAASCAFELLVPRIAEAQTREAFAGTYRIVVCKVAPCTYDDTLRRVAWGKLVLGIDSIPTAGLRVGIARVARSIQLQSGRSGSTAEIVNACYVMSRVDRHAGTNAGIGGAGINTWNITGGVVRTGLYRGPDAGNRIALSLVNGELRGTGTSNSMVASDDARPDTVVATRIGPPDYGPCLVAGAERLGPTPLSFRAAEFVMPQFPAVVDTNMRYTILLSVETASDSLPRLDLPRVRARAQSYWDPGGLVQLALRPSGVSTVAFSDSIVATVARLRSAGVRPEKITVIGYGYGATLAAHVSTKIDAPIGYVFIGGCGATVRDAASGRLRGDVLSVIGSATPDTDKCTPIFAASPQLRNRAEFTLVIPGTSSLETLERVEDAVSDWTLRRKVGAPWER